MDMPRINKGVLNLSVVIRKFLLVVDRNATQENIKEDRVLIF